jgi:hypothetical protein
MQGIAKNINAEFAIKVDGKSSLLKDLNLPILLLARLTKMQRKTMVEIEKKRLTQFLMRCVIH